VSADVAPRATPAAYAPSRTWADRFLAAVPLLSVFVWLAIVYVWESWDHVTPWLFTDELELTQIARSLAETGHAARRGAPYSIHSLYTVLTAPAWWLPTTQQSYAVVKYIGVFAMTLSVFPAYFLARLFAGPRPALFAAAATAAIPALVYSSFIVEEPLAYPWATLCLFLIAKALVTSRRPWIVGAAAASIVAPAFRDELLIVPLVYVIAALLMLWSCEPMLRRRAEWRAADAAGVALLVAGVGIVVGAIASSASLQYLLMTRYYHGWILSHALKAGGALTIGIGILPLVATCGVLVLAPGERRARALRVFRSLTVAAILLFGLYTGVKGSYNQYSFATRVWERNIIYVAPLLFAGTAVWLDRRRVNAWAAIGGAALAAYLLAKTPYLIEFHFSSDTPGVAILAEANRLLAWTTTDCRIALYGVLAVSAAVVLAPQHMRMPPRVPVLLAGFAAVFVVGWNVAAELSAADAANSVSRTFLANIGKPPTWLEQHTHGARTLYLGQQMNDQNSEWLLEFWNPSVQEVWSLDGTAQGPGRVQTPDVKPDGELIGKPPSTARYIVVETGIDPDGAFITRHKHAAGGGRRSVSSVPRPGCTPTTGRATGRARTRGTRRASARCA
jgi:hypothetical protein